MSAAGQKTDQATPPSNDMTSAAAPAPGGDAPVPGGPPTPDEPAGGLVEPPAGSGSPEGDKGDKAAAPASPEPPPVAAKQPLWKAEKYDKVVAQKKALEEEIARLKGDPNAPKLTEADVNRKAAEVAAQADFNRRCNEAAEIGKKAYPDFSDKLTSLREQVDLNDAQETQAYVNLVAAVLETGEAPRLLYELGANPDAAANLMKLSPVKQGMELAKMAAKQPEPEPSKAPKPMSVQVGGRGTTIEEIDPADPSRADKLSTDTWMKRRQAEIDKRRAAGERIW